MSDINFQEVIKKELPQDIDWIIDNDVMASYHWTDDVFIIDIYVEPPNPAKDEKCWIVNMVFGWSQCDASVNVSLRGRKLKSIYDRAYEKFQRRIKVYMERRAKQLVLIPKGKYPFKNLVAQDALEVVAARGLLDY